MTTHYQDREEDTFAKQKVLAEKLGRPCPLVFDIGANVGQSAAKYRTLFPDCPIHAFEPNPAPFGQLRSQWGGVDGVTLQQVALADCAGTMPFHATRLTEVGSLLRPADRLVRLSTGGKYEYDVISVTCRTLDDYCRQAGIDRIDIVKIDVQGKELAVLEGAATLLAKGAIAIIYLEIIFAETYEQQSELAAILTRMAQFGYRIWDLMPFVYTTPGRIWTANAIFTSEEAIAILEGNAVMNCAQ